MMGICQSKKAQVAKTYLTNDFLKKALTDKSEALASEQLKLIEEVQSELNDSSKACKARAIEVENNKISLLNAIIAGKPTELLIDNILETTVKLNKLKILESQLADIKSQSTSVNEILADLDKVLSVTLPEVSIPVAPIAVEEEKEPTYHLNLPEPQIELVRVAKACLESPNDIIENIIGDLRAKLELALKKSLIELTK